MTHNNTAHSDGRDPAPRVSVVVPVRNEAGNIAPLVDEIAAALIGRVFEVVYVNDGSQDATEQHLRSLMAERPWLRQIRHEKSCGQSAALRTGVAAARAPIIVTMDGGIAIAEDPNIRFNYKPNGAPAIRVEAIDTAKHMFKDEWTIDKSTM